MCTKKFLKVFGLLLVVVLLAAALPLQAKAQEGIDATTRYVCPPDQTCEFHSIQAAIDAANPGDTINVAAGTYNENITINKANITLQSTGTAEETIINANDGFGVFILKDLGTVTVDGFTVKGWLTAGIVQGTANREGTISRILNNIVIGETGDVNHGNCIQVTGDNSLIEGNTVTGAYYIGTGPYGASGILVYAANNVIVRNNTVSGADIGIAVAAGAYHNLGPISGVLVEGNEVFDSEIGISVSFDANGTSIKDNFVHGNQLGLCEEFYLEKGPTGTVALHNRIVGNEEQAMTGASDETPIPEDHVFTAEENWWGSVAGPGASQISGPVDFTPWCTDEHCVLFRMQDGGDRLAEIQNNDGGWDWFPADDGNPASISPLNTLGPTAKGLADAYLRSLSAEQLTALQKSGTLLLSKTDSFTSTDYELATALDQVLGGSVYTTHVKTNFYDKLANGTYVKGGTNYNTASYVTYLRSIRTGTQASIAAWDLGLHLVSAKYAGVSGDDLAAWIAGLQAEINELANDDYEVLGLAGAVYGLGFAGVDFDPTGGLFADEDSTADLAEALAGYQIDGGGFTWNVEAIAHGEQDLQTTAYAILALNAVDREGYLDVIQGAANYLLEQQLINGGWAYLHNGTEADEYNEVTGEVLSAIAVAYPVSSGDVQNMLDIAPEGSTIFIPEGIYTHEGAFEISTPHLAIVLSSGTVIQNSSPCFEINASYTQILAEPGAKCIPVGGANGIDVAGGLTDIRVKGLEIYAPEGATTGNGINFAGVVNGTVLVNNKIHNMPGDGIFFNAQPTGVIDIHGNLFQNNDGVGINNANGTGAIDATYNSWGSYGGPTGTGGDGVSANVDANPYTYGDFWMSSSGSPWADQVVKGQTITYTIKALVKEVIAADVTFTYPEGLTVTASQAITTQFESSTLELDTNTRTFTYVGMSTNGNENGTVDLFSVTFTANQSMRNVPMDIVTGSFGMAGVGSSSNVYVQSIDDGSITVIDLPTISSTDITGPYLAGVSREFQVTTTNPETGGDFEHVLFNYRISGAVLADIYQFQYFDGTSWQDMPLAADGEGNLVGYFGPSAGFPMAPEYSATTTFRITFKTVKNYPFTLTLNDLDADEEELARLAATATVNGNFAITGTFTMQGNLNRGGIPVTLTWTGTGWDYEESDNTEDLLVNNFQVTVTYGGGYNITTNQPRYLNLTTASNRTVTVDGAETLDALMLLGGNVQNAGSSLDKIDVDDASLIGTNYGVEGEDNDADANFDLRVNIQDLALVGGNFDLTSETAYADWTP